jgi:hypothetical protein
VSFTDKKAYFRNRKLEYQENPIQWLLAKSRARASKVKLEWDLSEEDIKIPEFCPYLGIRLTNNLDRANSQMSLDRIDSKKGYIKGNVEVISKLANVVKSNLTSHELITFAKGVLRRFNIT